MELSGLAMDNFPAIAANDSKTLRKLSLLEARMVGAGNESRDASLPPNEGSRGSENNSNSMSTIGFAKPRASVSSPGGSGGGGGSKPATDPIKDGSGGKRKATDSFSPPRPPSHSQNAGTPSTLSTSPGEGGDWSTARQASQGAGDDVPGLKRARTGGALQPPPPPPPPRFSLPQGEGSHQPPRPSGTGTGTGAGAVPGGVKGGQFHARRGSRGAEGSSYPSSNQAPGKSGTRASSDRTSHRSDHPDGSKQNHTVAGTSSDPPTGGDSTFAPPPSTISTAQGADFSPPSGGRSGKGGGQAPPVAASKTIQSYFFKPSNGTAVQNLAASYGAGELGPGQMRAASGLPQEVDLSGADGDSCRGEPSFAQPVARIGRSGSTGTVRGGDGKVPHHRLSHAAPSAGDQGVDQAQQANAQSRGQAADPAGGGMARAAGANTGLAGNEQEGLEMLHDRLREAKSVERELRNELARANLERGSMETMADSLRSQLERTMDEFKTKETDQEAQKKQLTSVVEGLLRKVAAQEASDSRATLTRDMLELGKIVSVKTGHIGKYVEAFEEGTSFKDVEKKAADMTSRKIKLEARKRAVSKLLRSTAPAAGDGSFSGQARLEAIEEEETVRMHLTALKREEVALQEEKRALDARKVLHIRELKRVAHEDRSKFAKRPTLNGRYVLLNLLGKGGFSEVWRAFDLVHAEDVAVKVHQLLNNWNEPQKANFIRHVTREYEV
ncbi:unnamed protein product [Ectocarpus fasciculatus]